MNELPFGIVERPVTYDDRLRRQLQRAGCDDCHSNANPTDDFTVEVFQQVAEIDPEGVRDRDDEVLETTRPGAEEPMPPNGQLDQVTRDLIQLWDWTGAD